MINPIQYRQFRYIISILSTFTLGNFCQAKDLTSGAALSITHNSASTTGFEKAIGSTMMFDFGYSLHKNFQLGLRTSASDSSLGPKANFRLSSGPLAKITIGKEWLVHASLGAFSETGLDSKTESYTSKGYEFIFGFNRLSRISQSVRIGWGSFVNLYRGTNSNLNASYTASIRNDGIKRGLSGNLIIDL